MKQYLLPLLTAMVFGAAGGMLINSGEKADNAVFVGADEFQHDDRAANIFATVSETEQEKIQHLEDRITELQMRLDDLQKQLHKTQDISADQQNNVNKKLPANNSDSGIKPMSVELLTEIGINADVAADIMRRSSEQEYKKLELRDRAIREGYINKAEYYRQLRELNKQSMSLDEELDEATYDRYLYATGHNNRVQVSSVMQGSPAELAGIQADDILLTYGDQRVQHYSDIRRATSQGELGEYVTVNILRDGEEMSFMLPRGPMGIRLQATRVEP